VTSGSCLSSNSAITSLYMSTTLEASQALLILHNLEPTVPFLEVFTSMDFVLLKRIVRLSAVGFGKFMEQWTHE